MKDMDFNTLIRNVVYPQLGNVIVEYISDKNHQNILRLSTAKLQDIEDQNERIKKDDNNNGIYATAGCAIISQKIEWKHYKLKRYGK